MYLLLYICTTIKQTINQIPFRHVGKGTYPKRNMNVKQILLFKPRYLYVDMDDLDQIYEMTYEDVKRLIKWHNNSLGTTYQTINEFNDDDDYRKIEIQ